MNVLRHKGSVCLPQTSARLEAHGVFLKRENANGGR